MCVVHDPTLFAAAILSIKFCFVGSLRFGKASSQFASAWKSIARIMKGLEKPPKKDQPKRLRGWQLEMQSGRKVAKKSVLEKTDHGLERPDEPHSGLANKLLSLWSCGTLSATMIREIAHLAMQDGADHPELVSLAKVGNWRAQTGNCHKQIINQFCPHIMLPEPFQVKVPCLDPKSSLEKEDWASLFLPHLLFAHLGEHYPMFFQKAFCLGKDNLQKFWAGVEKVGDDRIWDHPMCLEKHWRDRVIPLFLHGDGVEFHNRDSLMVWSWGCLLGDMPSMQQHMLLACWPKSCTTAQTWKPIWEWLKWSFEALGKGFHPTSLVPFPSASVFSFLAFSGFARSGPGVFVLVFAPSLFFCVPLFASWLSNFLFMFIFTSLSLSFHLPRCCGACVCVPSA